MNGTVKALSLALAVLAILCVFAGCSGKYDENVPGSGKWKGEYGKYVGDDEKNTDERFSLELYADGAGVFIRDGASFELTWSLDGESFTMTETYLGISIEYVGTLKDGTLDIFNDDPSDEFTYEYVFRK